MAEALVGGAFLSATLQVLFDRLASRGVLDLFRGPKRGDGDKLRKLKLKLMELHLVLDDAERKQFTHQSVKNWMEELKDAVYHAEDLLDEIATEALRLKVESHYQSGPNQVRAPISTSSSLLDAELVSKIKEVVDSLEYFATQKDVLGLKEVASRKWSHRLPSTSLVDESRVFGRDSDKEEIIKLLVSNEQSGSVIDVIAIVGMGGVGKTTLTQLVYNDGRVVEHFEIKAWVCVSEEFDVVFLAGVSSSNDDTQDLNQLQVRLKESLRASVPRSCAADQLVLAGCDGVGLGWQGVSSLVKLHISHLQNLNELPPELCALTNLEELAIESCPNLLSFSSSESNGVPPTLKHLSIKNCEKLVIPLSEQMEICCTSLERLELRGCDTLTHLPLDFFPKLRFLYIMSCDNLEALSIPNGCGLQNLMSLETVWILDCCSMVPHGILAGATVSQGTLTDCTNKKKTNGSKVLTVTWSDSEKEEESDSDDETENYTVFMTSTVKTTKTSSKASDTEKLDESDSTVGSLEEESNDEDINELHQAYNQLYKESYKLANSNVKLSKRLKEVLEEVDSLKKVNDAAQVETSQLKNHQTTLTDKVRFLEKDAFDREGFKKTLEDKVQKLESELVNVHLSFKKFDAGLQKIDEIWNAQRTSFDMTGIGYKEKATTSSQLASKPYSTKAQGTSSMPNIEIMPTRSNSYPRFTVSVLDHRSDLLRTDFTP
ncbi:NB-ARC domain-containing disease resistance protein [Actinidia rufa]|uniref:NB-ARC domain-containing disease resistance protein n=1 Tax=Actinidia rufa TaxID=165716 RepID=A0A7J0HF16_9ERIC|nr:NB-ARC domain-containing disease resistance protein [Actinidia rufa]